MRCLNTGDPARSLSRNSNIAAADTSPSVFRVKLTKSGMPGRRRIVIGGDGLASLSYEHLPVWVMGKLVEVPVKRLKRGRKGWIVHGDCRSKDGRWVVEDRLTPRGNTLVIDRQWRFKGGRLPSVRLGMDLRVPFTKLDHWAVPYISMNGNRGAAGVPSGMTHGGEPWQFREERCTAPGLMALESKGCVAGLYTEPGRDEQTISSCSIIPEKNGLTMRVFHPFRDTPVSYLGVGVSQSGRSRFEPMYVAGGGAQGFIVDGKARFRKRYFVVLDRPSAPRHGYARVWESAWRNIRDPLPPAIPIKSMERRLWEALDCYWFERGHVRGYSLRIDRDGSIEKSMAPVLAAGWCSPTGMMAWLALRRAIREGRASLAKRAVEGVDFFVRYAPRRNGIFHTLYSVREMKWKDSDINAVQMGGLVLWIIRCVKLLQGARLRGLRIDVRKWTEFALQFCDTAVRTQSPNGAFGAHWSPDGKLLGSERAMGVHAARAVLEAYRLTGKPVYLRAAERGARHYIRTMIDRETGYGDCTDISSGTTENDAAGVPDFMIDLYRITGKKLYLEKAIRAAEYCLSYLFAYNVYFPPETECGRRQMRTRGLAAISPETAFVCWFFAPQAIALLDLWKETGEVRWKEYAVAMIRGSVQMLTERGDTFGVAPHLLWQRAEVIPVLDTIKHQRIWKKGMTGYAWDPPVGWPAVFDLLNFAVVEDCFPEVRKEIESKGEEQ